MAGAARYEPRQHEASSRILPPNHVEPPRGRLPNHPCACFPALPLQRRGACPLHLGGHLGDEPIETVREAVAAACAARLRTEAPTWAAAQIGGAGWDGTLAWVHVARSRIVLDGCN